MVESEDLILEKCKDILRVSLAHAEMVWDNIGSTLTHHALNAKDASAREMVMDSVQTNIPGHEVIEPLIPEKGNFIALVIDIRESTKHLRVLAGKKGIGCLQRVFYETTGLLAVSTYIIENYSGKVTEYLGDGLLAFFNCKDNFDQIQRYSFRAAKMCFRAFDEILNPELKRRYDIPALSAGIGMAYSDAMVTTTGIYGSLHPKVIGICVYEASKLSVGENKIIVTKTLRNKWPSSKGGRVNFKIYKNSRIDIPAYEIDY